MDARIVRTRRRLQEALFALAGERGIDHVTISDIAERAGVNRTTFYQHYSDKETLLADALDLVASEAGAQLGDIEVLSGRPPEALVTFLTHIDAHAELYRRVFTEPGYGAVLARLRAEIQSAVAQTAHDHMPDGRVMPDEVLAAGMAGLIGGVVASWLKMSPRPDVATAAEWIWWVIQGPSRDTVVTS
ncbi:TetR/AcrR family transcriptional regulator [Demequina flava]|uniref:TetR/AcrR family transcriptional regulator n=1 Tax=Demequina flava TaxID=1095025 RepID=UPI00078455DA|nr:TetR/AcrR family transcriptional regulator [Demequina flava]